MQINFLLNLTLKVKPENIKENNIYMQKTVGFLSVNKADKNRRLAISYKLFSEDKCWKMALREISRLRIFNMENY